MSTQALREYLMARAKYENVPFELEDDFFETRFSEGYRTFFGVTISDDGVILSDRQKPAFFDVVLSRPEGKAALTAALAEEEDD